MTKTETLAFGAETGKILNLMIHSLYTNKDIFLRELVSNASDACDKLRYLSLTNSDLVKEDGELKITIKVDDKLRTITITDNGIGMNREDLIKNIGTIASSGTQKFIEQLSENNNQDMQLIGQFGVGFYSAFMVAEKVDVITKKAGEDTSFLWSSDGNGTYEIAEAKKNNHHKRGTSITLYLRKDLDEYLDKFKIKHIISTYSDHISIPIEWEDEKGSESLNNGSALWKKAKAEITEDAYKSFYKSVSYQPDDPWMIMHNKNEGVVEFTNLLFIPSTKPFDLFHPDRKSRVKLYVKRVFITDEGAEIVPPYLRFLRGVVDSEDLPLNISRETLQHNSMIAKIKKSLTKRVFSELKKKMSEERESYESFWNNFGAVIKEGLCESLDDKEQILDCCLFKSALTDKLISLNEYIENMKPSQKFIYFLSGEQEEKLKNSAQLEGLLKHNIDVLLFVDTVDDFWVNVCIDYQGKELKSATRSGIDLDEIIENENPELAEKNKKVQNSEENKELVDFFKTTLDKKISDAKISGKLVESPVVLSVAEGAMDIRMERYLKEQKQLAVTSAKILEINNQHPIVKKIQYLLKNDTNQAAELVQILFDQACIIEGENIVDLTAFTRKINHYIEKAIAS